jgi:hypothetical protein
MSRSCCSLVADSALSCNLPLPGGSRSDLSAERTGNSQF